MKGVVQPDFTADIEVFHIHLERYDMVEMESYLWNCTLIPSVSSSWPNLHIHDRKSCKSFRRTRLVQIPSSNRSIPLDSEQILVSVDDDDAEGGAGEGASEHGWRLHYEAKHLRSVDKWRSCPKEMKCSSLFWRRSSQITVGVEQITFLECCIEVLFGERRIITQLFWCF